MAAFLPIAVLMSLLITGTTASGYGNQTPPSPSTPAPYTPTPATPPPPPTPTTPPPSPYTQYQPTTPPKPAPAHGYDDDDKKLVVVHVEGLVVCQSCQERGSQSLHGAAPLPRAQVLVNCRDRKNRVMAYRRVVADSNGYFHAEFGVERAGEFWTKDTSRACFVRLLASPDPRCNVVANIHRGMEGAPLRDEGKQWIDGRGIKNVVHAAGPLAFRPAKCAPTHQY